MHVTMVTAIDNLMRKTPHYIALARGGTEAASLKMLSTL